MNIHDNILKLPIRGPIELAKPEIVNLNVEKPGSPKLKGHSLSPNTIRNSVPSFSLQLYSNPCMFWLAQPAIILLAAKYLDKNVTQGTGRFLFF